MFTGIIEEQGRIRTIEPTGSGMRLTFECSTVLDDIEMGASIAVNGCCLTVVDWGDDWWAADAVPETMARTALGKLTEADTVNLERPVRPTDRMGGHIVQGHVDATTTVETITPEDDGSHRYTFAMGHDWARYVCEKGSIAIDGISLTVAAVGDDTFDIAVIPHTSQVTNLGRRSPGDQVNIEVDVLAKYVERQVAASTTNGASS